MALPNGITNQKIDWLDKHEIAEASILTKK